MFWWHLTNLTFIEDKIERALATLLGERPSKKKPFVAGHSIFGIRDSLGMLVSILNKILFKILLGDTIQTTYYFINQLPSFILHKKIPYSILFLAYPLFLRLLEFLDVFALFIIFLYFWILDILNVYFWDILKLKKDTNVLILCFVNTLLLLM